MHVFCSSSSSSREIDGENDVFLASFVDGERAGRERRRNRRRHRKSEGANGASEYGSTTAILQKEDVHG